VHQQCNLSELLLQEWCLEAHRVHDHVADATANFDEMLNQIPFRAQTDLAQQVYTMKLIQVNRTKTEETDNDDSNKPVVSPTATQQSSGNLNRIFSSMMHARILNCDVVRAAGSDACKLLPCTRSPQASRLPVVASF
jgi:hypothetical protein